MNGPRPPRRQRAAGPIVIVALIALTGCVGTSFNEASCRTVSKLATGDLAEDVVGTWEGFGIDSRLLYLFEADGGFRFIEPPNRYAPQGLEEEGTWIVLGEDELSVSWAGGDSTAWFAEVTDQNLLLTSSSAFGDDTESWTDTWSRVCCTGSPKPCF